MRAVLTNPVPQGRLKITQDTVLGDSHLSSRDQVALLGFQHTLQRILINPVQQERRIYMFKLVDFPVVFSLLSLLVMWVAARLAASVPNREKYLEGVRDNYGVVFGATLTLLGLIIGFTFSMAVGRFDQRKSLEEEEANAIGTEYVRADLLPAADAANIRTLLKQYLDERLRFYSVINIHMSRLGQINETTSELQTKLWNAVTVPAQAAPTPVISLAVSGMND